MYGNVVRLICIMTGKLQLENCGNSTFSLTSVIVTLNKNLEFDINLRK